MLVDSETAGMPRRILIGPGEVAGYYYNLYLGFQKIGQATDYVNLWGTHPFGYNLPARPLLLRWRDAQLIRAASARFFEKFVLKQLAKVTYATWFLQVLFRYDAFIFSASDSLLRKNRDLPMLKLFGKKVICNLFHGSDARPPYINGATYSDTGERPSFEELLRLTELRKSVVEKCEKYATWIIGAPYSSSPFLRRPFINALFIGSPWPVQDLSQNQVSAGAIQAGKSRSFRVLHAPSRPFAKGTPHIRNAIQALREEGFDIQLIEIQGMANHVVLEQIKRCDFVVDQVFSDSPMPGLALEAAANARPTIVGGEHLEELKRFVSPEMWPPTITCRPEKILETVRRLLVHPEEIPIQGRRARNFVETYWRAEDVAERLLLILQGKFPRHWLLSPLDVPFPREMGIPNEEAKANVSKLISFFGPESLGLDSERLGSVG